MPPALLRLEEVISLKQMAGGAVCLLGVDAGEAVASKQVHAAWDSFEMVRIDAVSHAAEMIDLESFGDCSMPVLVRAPMSVGVSPLAVTLDEKDAVTVGEFWPSPEPMPVSLVRDEFIESFGFRAKGFRHDSTLYLVGSPSGYILPDRKAI